MSVDSEAVDGKKGLYELTPESAGDDAPPFRLRFVAGHAYVGINAPDKAMAADGLVPADDILVRDDTAQFSYRVHYQRLPAGLKKSFTDFLTGMGDKFDAAPLPEAGRDAIKKLAGMYKRLGEQVVADGEVAAVRVRLDARTGDVMYEGSLTGRKGSQLAKDIAARKPTTNAFAGLLTPDTVTGFVLQLPLFAPEIREAAAEGVAQGWKQVEGQVPPQYKDVAAEVAAGLGRTVKSGEFDLGAALTGPDKDGLYTVTAAVSYFRTAKLEAAVKKLHADAPEEVQNQIKLDAAKFEGVNIHRAPVGLFLPPEAKKVFGDKASVAVAFAPGGVFLTFGPDSIGAMKAALAAKPGPAKAFDVVVNTGEGDQGGRVGAGRGVGPAVRPGDGDRGQAHLAAVRVDRGRRRVNDPVRDELPPGRRGAVRNGCHRRAARREGMTLPVRGPGAAPAPVT